MWSAEMVDFVGKCLQKRPEDRATSEALADHPWIMEDVHRIRQGRGLPILAKLVSDNMEAIRRMRAGGEEGEAAAGSTQVEDSQRTLARGGPAAAAGRTSTPDASLSAATLRVVTSRRASLQRVSVNAVGVSEE